MSRVDRFIHASYWLALRRLGMGVCIAASVAVVLSGCMSVAPSGFPTMRLPSQQRMPQPPPMPSTSGRPSQSGSPSSSQTPSSSSSGQSGGGMPTPSMPTNPSATPSASTSTMPRPSMTPPSSPGDASQQSSGAQQLPRIPGMPQRPRGDSQGDADSSAGDPSDGDANAGGESMRLPSAGGPLRTADEGEYDDEESANGEGGVAQQQQRSGDEDQSASAAGAENGTDLGGLPSSGAGEDASGGQEQVVAGDPGAGILGTPNDSENTGWVISNDLPENEKVRNGAPTVPSAEEEELGSKSEADEELEQTLAGIDGSIMSDREEQAEKLNERAGGVALPGDLAGAGDDQADGDPGSGTAPPAAGGTSREEIPHVNHPNRRSLPNENPTATTGSDVPDARDDDVVARQLREAALAEKDPKVREGLWEELRRYKERTK